MTPLQGVLKYAASCVLGICRAHVPLRTLRGPNKRLRPAGRCKQFAALLDDLFEHPQSSLDIVVNGTRSIEAMKFLYLINSSLRPHIDMSLPSFPLVSYTNKPPTIGSLSKTCQTPRCSGTSNDWLQDNFIEFSKTKKLERTIIPEICAFLCILSSSSPLGPLCLEKNSTKHRPIQVKTIHG